MASNKQTVKLYWVTTADHDEDWFIFAESAWMSISLSLISTLIIFLSNNASATPRRISNTT